MFLIILALPGLKTVASTAKMQWAVTLPYNVVDLTWDYRLCTWNLIWPELKVYRYSSHLLFQCSVDMLEVVGSKLLKEGDLDRFDPFQNKSVV